MDYIGSKKMLNEWMFDIFKSSIGKELKGLNFIDGCAGTGSTSIFACKQGMNVYSNDLQTYSAHIVKAITISDSKLEEAYEHIDNMMMLPELEGFFFHTYSESAGRLYMADHNARKLDACRQYVEQIIDEDIKSYLLYCLLESMSRILNVTGVQVSFLKKLKPIALLPLRIRKEATFSYNNVNVFSEDVLELIQKIDTDVLYIDPPYNKRQYGSNYHLYETLVRYDNPQIADGITGYRQWKEETKSHFCSRLTFLNLIKDIILLTSAKNIFISYSSDGIISQDKIMECIENLGYNVECHRKEQKRYKADSNRNNKEGILYELLFDIKKY